MSERIEQEVSAALDFVDRLAAAWTDIGKHQKAGETTQIMYSNIIEFANLRMKTASTLTLLIQSNRISDALGLSRSLLEHALLLRLLTKGNRYFQVGPEAADRSHSEFKKLLLEKRSELRR